MTSPIAAPAAYDPAVLADLLGDEHPDSNAANEILDLFAKTWPETLEAFRRAVADADMAALRLHAHTLKSTSASVGAMEMAEFIVREEDRLKTGEAANADLAKLLAQLFERFETALARHRATAA